MEQIKTKQRMKGESFHLCKLQMENRVIQTAKADSVIKGVYCFNITQNSSCLLWLLWCNRLWLVATGRTTSCDFVWPVTWPFVRPVWPQPIVDHCDWLYNHIWPICDQLQFGIAKAWVLNTTVVLAATNLPLVITHDLYNQSYTLSAITPRFPPLLVVPSS